MSIVHRPEAILESVTSVKWTVISLFREPFGVDSRTGGTSSIQGGDEQNQTKVVNDEDAMVGHLHLLVQGIRQLQQLQIFQEGHSRDGDDEGQH